jgi:hypothetical protein
MSAPASITVGSGVYNFVRWDGDWSSATRTFCVPGNADNGKINVTAHYAFDHPATKLSQAITFAALAGKTYGDADFAVSASSDSGLPVSFAVGASDPCTISTATVHITGIGTCTVTATQAGDATYDPAAPVSRSFAIAPRSIPVTVSGSQTYNGSPTFAKSSTPVTGVSVDGTPTCTTLSPATTIAPALNVGSYTILGSSCSALSLSGADAANYVISYVGGAFTVSAATITATVTGGHTYGGTPAFSFTDSAPHGVTGTVSCTSTSDVPALSIDAALPQGTYTIDGSTCTGLTAPTNYVVAYAGGSYLVTKAQVPVTVTGSKTYGSNTAVFTGTPSGTLPSGVTYSQSGLACTTVGVGTSIDPTLGAGSYVINPASCTGGSLSGATAGNYDIVYGGGAFAVAKRAVNVGASGTQVYGGTPTYTPDFTATDWANSDDESVVSGQLSCLTTDSGLLHVGTHALASCSGLMADNYTFAYSPLGALTVTPKGITVAVTGTQVYGSLPTFTPNYGATAFVSPDTSSVFAGDVLSCSPSSTTTTVGNHTISNCSGLSADDYNVGYSYGLLAVTQKPITVNVTGTQVYGGSPGFTPHFNAGDFVSPDTSSVVGGTLSCSTSATSSSPVATGYSISACEGLAATNYSIGYSYGTLSVTPKPITVVVNGTQVYGGTGITYTPDYTGTGWVNGDGPGIVTGSLTGCSTDAVAASDVGSGYSVTGCSGLSAPNYTVTLAGGTFTVTKAPLTLTAVNQSMTYGDPIPALTYSITGYVLGQTFGATSGVTGTTSCSTTATTSSGFGGYPITCPLGTLNGGTNYAFLTPVNGTLTIAKKAAVLGYTGSLFWSTGSATATTADVTFQALLTPSAGGTPNLALAHIVFDYWASTNLSLTPTGTCAPAASNPTSSSGIATCTLNLAIDNYTVVARLLDNPYFTAPNADPVVVTVYQPSTDKFVTGGGWVTDPSGSAANPKGNFGFTARYKSGTTPSGQAVYVYRGADGYNYVIKSNSWQGGGLSFGSNTASFSGKCNVTVIDRSTGLAVSGLGGGGYTYRVDVTDNGSPGSSDSYAISVYTAGGVLYHQSGTTSAQRVLGGGNIVVHSTNTK